jgi:hypothetical protein
MGYHSNNKNKASTENASASVGGANFDRKRPRDASSRGSIASIPENPPSKESKDYCRGCGRIHKGDCELVYHPNFNRSDLTWAESGIGKQFKKQGHDVLPYSKDVTGNAVTIPEPVRSRLAALPKQNKSFKSKKVNNIDLIECFIASDNNTLAINALPDSGSLCSNYVSEEVADWLKIQWSMMLPARKTIYGWSYWISHKKDEEEVPR